MHEAVKTSDKRPLHAFEGKNITKQHVMNTGDWRFSSKNS